MSRRFQACEAAAVVAVLYAVFLSGWSHGALAADQAAVLQQQGIKRIDAFIAHFRKTGDGSTLRPELDRAYDGLTASYALFSDRRDWDDAALNRIKLGDIMRMTNRWPEAIAFYREGYNLAKRAGHAAYQAKARIGEARAYKFGFNDLGATGVAIAEAVELSDGIADNSIRFDALDFQAALLLDRGELAAALDTETKALAIAEEADDEVALFYVFMTRGGIYRTVAEQCDYKRDFELCYEAVDLAKVDFERARDAARRLGFDFWAQMMDEDIQSLATRRLLIDQKKSMHEMMLQAPIFNPKTADNVLVHEYFLFTRLPDGGRAGPSEDMKQFSSEDMERFIGSKEHSTITDELRSEFADLLAAMKKSQRGDPCTGVAAGMAVCDDARNAYTNAQLLEMQGQSDAALEGYLRALDLLEKDRSRLPDERGRGLFLEDKISFYYQPILHFLSRRRHAEAFDLLERSRARALADLLASREVALAEPRDREFYARLLGLRAEIAHLQGKLFEVRSLGVTEANRDKVTNYERRIHDLEGQHSALTTAIAASAPKLRELIIAEPASLENLQELAAREGFDVLQYLVLEHAVIVWHVGANGSQARSVFLPRSVAAAKVAALRKSVQQRQRLSSPDTSFDEEIARQLFLFLIQPLIEYITSDRLVIMPHDALHQLPFQVLLDPADGQFLGEKFQLTYVPSATILAGLERTHPVASGQLLAVANPTISTAPREVQTIGALYPGRSDVLADVLPTEAALRNHVAGADLVHLSVHGYFSAEEPLLSYLELKPEAADDGRLTAAEMFGLQLDRARLVVLSACETGQVTVTNANETLGMIRALLYAGADTLVLSLWAVDAGSTAAWMEAFYQAVRTTPPAEAARQALVTVKAMPEYRHPFYWAPFQLVGR